MPMDAEQTMYTGAAASTLFAEVILQLASAYLQVLIPTAQIIQLTNL
jgi:hypothetical protein